MSRKTTTARTAKKTAKKAAKKSTARKTTAKKTTARKKSAAKKSDKKIRVQQVRSPIGFPRSQREVLRSLDRGGPRIEEDYGFTAKTPAGWSTGDEIGGGVTEQRRQATIDAIRASSIGSGVSTSARACRIPVSGSNGWTPSTCGR